MPRRSPTPLPWLAPPTPDAYAAFWRHALVWWEIALAAPVVVGLRSARMAAAGASPSRRDRRESVRMVQEKAEAGLESMLAVGTRLWQAQLAWPGAAWPLATAALRPVHRRVTANARRLSRRR